MVGKKQKQNLVCLITYGNDTTDVTSWDHPYMLKILQELGTYNEIRYAAYRTAFKIRHIQTRLRMHQIHLSAVEDTFYHHGYREGDEDVVSCGSLLTVLTSLFTNMDLRSDFPVRTAGAYAEVMLNFLLSLFDKERTGSLPLLPTKLILILLSAARLAEKYKAFYKEIADPSTFVSGRRFKIFLENVIKLPNFLREGTAFGNNVKATVAHCINMSSSFVGLSEDTFYAWLLREPQILVWLPTFHRVIASETVRHDTKCNVCKCLPIVGFRYKCLQCFKFNLCQRCFYTGCTRKNHKLKHPIQEYCIVSSIKVDAKAFMKTIRNNLSKKHRQKARQKYPPVMSDSKLQDQSCPSVHSAAVTPSSSNLTANQAEEEKKGAVLQDQDTNKQQDCKPQRANKQGKRICADDKENRQPDIPIVTEAVLPIPKSEDLPHKAPHSSTDQVVTLMQQRKELEKVISQLEEENRMLHQQLNTMKESSDTESNMSVAVNYQDKIKRLKGNEFCTPLHVNTDPHRPGGDRTDLYSSHHYSPLGVEPLSPISCSPHAENTEGSGVPTALSSHMTAYSSCLPSSMFTMVSHDTELSPGIQYKGQANPQSPCCRYRTSTKDDISILSDTNQDFISGLHNKDFSPKHYDPSQPYRVPDSGDVPYDSLDDIDASPSHFTLPSFANSLDHLDGEEEIEQMIQNLDQIFPSNLSYSAYSVLDTEEPDEMIQAASSIGKAMSQLVSEAIQAKYS
ncbi:hypothetical protein FSP39_019885 [Pinctada imbricata]|uniref:ZZ-type domain-containing protein n=1 Tax=Pinctada imbricata TaxID=66713 RepID=A0AA88Y2I6_PINIB|nr:hypothetical protein FSP39_019885 [Pinctada imbricata]